LGKFDHIASQYKNKKNRQEIWNDLEVLLRLGMPPMGKGRWGWYHDLQSKHKH